MDEEQFKRLALWQQKAEQIECKIERYFEALQLFSDDDNFEVWPDGSVGFIDHSKFQTFEEACGYEWSPQYWADRTELVAPNRRTAGLLLLGMSLR